MPRHTVSVRTGYDGQIPVYQGYCTCRCQPGPITKSSADAGEWGDQHMRLVTQAQVHRQTNGSLTAALAHYRRMCEVTEDPAEKALWGRLAAELEERLGLHITVQQDPLF